MKQSVTFTFYIVKTTADGEYTETLVYSNVSGICNVVERVIAEEKTESNTYYQYLFIPNRYMPLLNNNMNIIDSNSVKYRVVYIEDYESHQEIFIRKVN